MRLTTHADDTALIISFRKGEPSAFVSVYKQYVSALRHFIGQKVQDRHVAEDITADAFAKTFTRHADIVNMHKLRGFLYTTANNAALDYLRTQKRHIKAHEEIRYLTEDNTEEPQLRFLEAEAFRAVYEAIEALPPQPRQVIRMTFVEGKKLPEIAAELGLSYNTVQNHRGRGLEMIRIHLLKNDLLSYGGLLLSLAFLKNQ